MLQACLVKTINSCPHGIRSRFVHKETEKLNNPTLSLKELVPEVKKITTEKLKSLANIWLSSTPYFTSGGGIFGLWKGIEYGLHIQNMNEQPHNEQTHIVTKIYGTTLFGLAGGQWGGLAGLMYPVTIPVYLYTQMNKIKEKTTNASLSISQLKEDISHLANVI